jgi:hypothetical protein
MVDIDLSVFSLIDNPQQPPVIGGHAQVVHTGLPGTRDGFDPPDGAPRRRPVTLSVV